MSSRRNASLVVALGVASLAAMVATSELLVESFGRPVPERLDPPFPDLRPPEVIQVDPPERKRARPLPGLAGDPPPRRAPATRPPGGPGPERVAPAWSWSWSVARPGGTGSWATGSPCPDRHRRDEPKRRWDRDDSRKDRGDHWRDRDREWDWGPMRVGFGRNPVTIPERSAGMLCSKHPN